MRFPISSAVSADSVRSLSALKWPQSGDPDFGGTEQTEFTSRPVIQGKHASVKPEASQRHDQLTKLERVSDSI